MIAFKIEIDFVSQINNGQPYAKALRTVEEEAKSKVKYKRFGAVPTTLYEFWDKSVFLAGASRDGWIFCKACRDRDAADSVVLTGSWDQD
jgi:hypothetical protein